MKKLNKIESFLGCVVVFFLLIIFSEKAHEFIKKYLTINCLPVIQFVLGIIFAIALVKKFLEIYQSSLSKRTRKMWLDIKENTRVNIIHYVDKGKELHPSVIYQLMIIYRHDAETYGKFLDMLIQAFDADDRVKKFISYILLNSRDKSEIARIFEERPELKEQCEKLSKEVADSATNFELDENVVSRELIIGLLHCCLPGTKLCKNKMVYLMRVLLSWVLRNQSDVTTDEEEEIMVTVAMLFPLIRNKLQNCGIYDEYIEKDLHKIENSKWFKKAVYKSYKYINKSLDHEPDNLLQSEECIKHICMVYTYYDRLLPHQLGNLYCKVKEKKRELRHHLESDKKMILLALCASSMQELSSGDDLLYQWTSVVCSCAEQFMM